MERLALAMALCISCNVMERKEDFVGYAINNARTTFAFSVSRSRNAHNFESIESRSEMRSIRFINVIIARYKNENLTDESS